ncbi:hypothetical protein NDU88_001649 [Pleurodeles waltl]|uniref:Uncharacterized protein n=1 Tax=Pleurodeles waltl TaxID=8319 RepID=A0AAV7R9P7_PLEWA|nr:hypothetical protein NDU88_001649 [Pleurodeles waltl]
MVPQRSSPHSGHLRTPPIGPGTAVGALGWYFVPCCSPARLRSTEMPHSRAAPEADYIFLLTSPAGREEHPQFTGSGARDPPPQPQSAATHHFRVGSPGPGRAKHPRGHPGKPNILSLRRPTTRPQTAPWKSLPPCVALNALRHQGEHQPDRVPSTAQAQVVQSTNRLGRPRPRQSPGDPFLHTGPPPSRVSNNSAVICRSPQQALWTPAVQCRGHTISCTPKRAACLTGPGRQHRPTLLCLLTWRPSQAAPSPPPAAGRPRVPQGGKGTPPPGAKSRRQAVAIIQRLRLRHPTDQRTAQGSVSELRGKSSKMGPCRCNTLWAPSRNAGGGCQTSKAPQDQDRIQPGWQELTRSTALRPSCLAKI